MKFKIINGLPLVSIIVEFQGKQRVIHDVLIDTGCSTTIFDTDLMEDIGLMLDLENAITRTMYGIGGTEICIQQKVNNLKIGFFVLDSFIIQLGSMVDLHGFGGIIGSDFFKYNRLVIDFELMMIYQKKKTS